MADCIGPHHRGKKGSSCRTGGGVDCQVQRDCDQVQVIDTGDRERSDSAMGAQWCEVVSLMNQKELQYWFQVGK